MAKSLDECTLEPRGHKHGPAYYRPHAAPLRRHSALDTHTIGALLAAIATGAAVGLVIGWAIDMSLEAVAGWMAGQ